MSNKTDVIIKLLSDIIEDKIDLVLASRELNKLYHETNREFIPLTLGVFYESEFDELPIPSEYHYWNSDALKVKLKIVDLYRNDIIEQAKSFLEHLNKASQNLY